MEPPTPTNEEDDDDVFLDALDEFPFYDCPSSFSHQSQPSTSSSTDSPSPSTTTSSTLRRRLLSRRLISGNLSNDFTLDSSLTSEIDSVVTDPKPSFGDRSYHRVFGNLKENENPEEQPKSNEDSAISTANDESATEQNDSSINSLIFIAGLLIKAISFQINLFITITTFPLFLLYHSYTCILNPYQTLRRSKSYLTQKLSKLFQILYQRASPIVREWLSEHKWVWKLAMQWGWGFLWSIYVATVLCGLLISSAVISGILMRYLVEEPIHIKEMLNFDYTKLSPVAYLPIVSCDGVNCGEDCKDKSEVMRIIPPRHRLQVIVGLTLPESEYNRNLGVFQVRVEFLSASGKSLASLRRPSMLQFKSEPIRLLLTFLKIAPIVAGYVSESQTLNLKFRGFTEGDVPTACLKVTIEQRAEFRPGAGIPEIYDVSLIMESELPLFKRIIWYWKKTIFIWISMMSFTIQLLFTLVCCRPCILPKARPRGVSARGNATQNSLPVQS